MQPRLSIITINFNNLEGLKKTAESVINQTWKDFEWIIIDGGSTDGSKEYIVTLYDNLNDSGWNPITYWCSEPDKGIYNAMNKGIANANGEYLNFMNSGDCFYGSNTLENVSTFINSGNADVYYGDLSIVNGTVIIEQRNYPDRLDLFDLYFNGLGHQAQYFRASLLMNNGFDEEYKIIGDHAKNIEFMMKECSFNHIPFNVAKFDGNGISSKIHAGKMSEVRTIESKYIPDNVLSVLLRLYIYENGHIYQRVKKIKDRGGLTFLVLKFFLKITDMIQKI